MVHGDHLRQSTFLANAWKWALGTCVGAASAVFVIASQGPVPAVVASPPAMPVVEATGTASVGGTTMTTASVELSAAPEAPVIPVPLPPEKPAARPEVAAASPVAGQPASPFAPAHTGLTRFEACLPDCETRDPLVAVAGTPAPVAPRMVMVVPAATQLAPPQAADGEPSLTFLPPPLLESLQEPVPVPPQPSPADLAVDTGHALVEQVQGASNAVIDGTRRVIDVATDLVF